MTSPTSKVVREGRGMGQFSKLGRCARILFACVPAVLAMAGPWSSAMAEDPNAPVPGGVSSAAAVKPPVARQIEPMVPPIRRVQPKNPPLTVSVPQPAAKQAEKSATSPTATPTATPAPIVASPPVASQRQSANAAPGSAPTVEKATKNVAAARAVAVKYVVHTCRVGQD